MNPLVQRQLLQNKADMWDKRYRLILDQNNRATGNRSGSGKVGGYFANMSDNERSHYDKWLKSGGLQAYPNDEERRRAWLMYRRGSIDARIHGQLSSDEEYNRHLSQSGIKNPYREQLKQFDAGMKQQKSAAPPSMKNLNSRYNNKMQQANSVESQMKKLAEDYNKKMEEANAVNEARYRELEKQYQDRHMRGVESVKGWEDSQLLKTAEKFEEARENIGAKYQTNLTIGDAFRARSQRDQNMAETAIRSDANARKTELDMRLDKDLADFRERRDDIQPDFNQLARIAEMIGQGGNGQGLTSNIAKQSQNVRPGYDTNPMFFRPRMNASGAPIVANPYANAASSFFGQAPNSRSRPQIPVSAGGVPQLFAKAKSNSGKSQAQQMAAIRVAKKKAEAEARAIARREAQQGPMTGGWDQNFMDSAAGLA